MTELTLRYLDSGYVHIRGTGPANWAQGPSVREAEPFREASDEFRAALRRLKERDDEQGAEVSK